MRMGRLVRNVDVSGVSGTGVVAELIEFSNGTVALRWLSEWPTSVVFHDKGIEGVLAVHGHNGNTVIEWAESCFPEQLELPLFPEVDLDIRYEQCCEYCQTPVESPKSLREEVRKYFSDTYLATMEYDLLCDNCFDDALAGYC